MTEFGLQLGCRSPLGAKAVEPLLERDERFEEVDRDFKAVVAKVSSRRSDVHHRSVDHVHKACNASEFVQRLKKSHDQPTEEVLIG